MPESIERLRLELNRYHWDISNGYEIEPTVYAGLVEAEKSWAQKSHAIKATWLSLAAKGGLSEAEIASGRRFVVSIVQLHRAIQDVTAFYSEKLGHACIVSDTNFKLTASFWRVAISASYSCRAVRAYSPCN